MGAKKTLPVYQAIINGVMTGTSTIRSIEPTYIYNLDNCGLEISWTGTPTGTITIECSNSYNPNDGSGSFYALTFNPDITQPAGSAGGYLIDLNQVPFEWIRVSYTNASGSGVLNVWISAKDLN